VLFLLHFLLLQLPLVCLRLQPRHSLLLAWAATTTAASTVAQSRPCFKMAGLNMTHV
jgi:hypothetical protein